MNEPKITIILAVFNNVRDIANCLISISNQTYKNIEFIVIDNNSTDGTEKIIDSFINKIDIYIRENDTGIYNAWNKAINISSGEWLCFIGSDDYLFPNAIENLVKCITKTDNCNFVSAKVKMNFNSDNLIIGKCFNKNTLKYHQSFVHIGSLTSKSLFLNFGLFDESYKIAGDYDFYLRVRNYITNSFLNEVIGKIGPGISTTSLLVIKESFIARQKHGVLNTFLSHALFYKQVLFFKIKTFLMH